MDGLYPTHMAQAELAQARLRLVLDAARMGLWDWDVVTGELVWDERTAALFGTTLDQVSGTITDFDDRVHPEDMPRVREVLSGAIESAGTVDVEFRVLLGDGSVRWLHGRGQALTDNAGRVVRLIGANLDVTDTRRIERTRTVDAERMAGLVDVAHALGAAGSEEAVVQVLTAHCASAMGANGTVLVLRTTTDAPVARPGAALDAGQGPGQQSGQGTGEMAGVRALTSGYFDDEVRADVAVLPVGFPLPMVHTAMTGRAYFLGDRAAAVAAFPGGQDLYVRARTEASASVPLEGAGGTFGALAVAFADTRTWRSQDRNLLRALAALTAQALERIRALDAEMEAARAVGRLSETLQRALLTAPPQPDDLAIAARYQPAAQQAQVGGDWYDAFVNPDGNTTLVIGDVTGHDRDAAAAMAQTRNVLRGVAQALGQPPAAVLSLLDKALARLQVHTLATAVLCDIRTAPAFTTPPMTAPMIAAPTITTSMAPPAPDYQPSTASSDNGSVGGAAAGSGGCDQQEDPARGRILRWSNAGHPPPLLIQCDGTPVLLERTPDLLLGVDPDARRVDYEHHVLAVGDTVVLYTDGLIERRGEPLDQALTRLRNAAHDLAHLPLDDMVDALLERLASDAEDDVAVIALRPLAPAPH